MEDIISKIKDKIATDTERRVVMRDRISAIRLEIMYLDGTIDGLKDAALIIESEGDSGGV